MAPRRLPGRGRSPGLQRGRARFSDKGDPECRWPAQPGPGGLRGPSVRATRSSPAPLGVMRRGRVCGRAVWPRAHAPPPGPCIASGLCGSRLVTVDVRLRRSLGGASFLLERRCPPYLGDRASEAVATAECHPLRNSPGAVQRDVRVGPLGPRAWTCAPPCSPLPPNDRGPAGQAGVRVARAGSRPSTANWGA